MFKNYDNSYDWMFLHIFTKIINLQKIYELQQTYVYNLFLSIKYFEEFLFYLSENDIL